MAFMRGRTPPGWEYDYATDTYITRAELRITRRELEERAAMGNDDYNYWMEKKRHEMHNHMMHEIAKQQRHMVTHSSYDDPYRQQMANPLGASGLPDAPQKQPPKQKAEKPKHDPLLLLLEEENAA